MYVFLPQPSLPWPTVSPSRAGSDLPSSWTSTMELRSKPTSLPLHQLSTEPPASRLRNLPLPLLPTELPSKLTSLPLLQLSMEVP